MEKSRIMNYSEMKNGHAPMVECFFAFSQKQFDEGVKKHNLEGRKIYSGKYGLYGTSYGIEQFYKFYENQHKYIAENCNPQEVYEYEFDNHECGYVCDDEEAIDIVVSYFGEEAVKNVKRRYAYKYAD